MRSGRSALGVIMGVLLGIGVVALAGPGLNLSAAQFAGPTYPPNQTSIASGQTTTTSTVETPSPGSATSTSLTTTHNPGTGPSAIFNANGPAVAQAAQVDNIPKQSAGLTGLVFLPVFAALMFGFVLYRVSKRRNAEAESPELA